MKQKYKYVYNVAFSNEEEKAIKLLNKFKSIVHIKDFVYCITDKKTNFKTKKILKNFCKNKKNFKLLNILNSKTFSQTKLLGLKKSTKFDYIFDLDGNNAHDPRSINHFKKIIEKYNIDAVCSSRFKEGGSYKSNNKFSRYAISLLGGKISNFFLGMKYTDPTGGYICFNNKIKKHILKTKIYSKAHFYHVELKNVIKLYEYKEVPIIYSKSDSKLKKFTLLISLINLIRICLDNLFKKNVINPS